MKIEKLQRYKLLEQSQRRRRKKNQIQRSFGIKPSPTLSKLKLKQSFSQG